MKRMSLLAPTERHDDHDRFIQAHLRARALSRWEGEGGALGRGTGESIAEIVASRKEDGNECFRV